MNSIEEDIKIVENYLAHSAINETDSDFFKNGGWETVDLEIPKSMQHILFAYKRVLKENEELNSKIPNLEQGTEILMETNTKLTNELNDSISKQKIKDIIDRIDYDIKKTKEIISNNSNIYTSDRKNDYQIVRLRAMNTKSLDIKKRLQELLESEE